MEEIKMKVVSKELNGGTTTADVTMDDENNVTAEVSEQPGGGGTKIYQVEDIDEIPPEILKSLNLGDIVESNGYGYTVTWMSGEKDGLDLTCVDPDVGLRLYYGYDSDEDTWSLEDISPVSKDLYKVKFTLSNDATRDPSTTPERSATIWFDFPYRDTTLSGDKPFDEHVLWEVLHDGGVSLTGFLGLDDSTVGVFDELRASGTSENPSFILYEHGSAYLTCNLEEDTYNFESN